MDQIIDGKFELLEELGRGASSIVYRAKHLVLEQIVVLKVIDKNLLSPVEIKRFQNEAAVLSTMSHPNIVKFISYGSLPDGRQYMVLEYLDGITLSKYLANGGVLSPQEAIPLFIDIAEALKHSHQKGIIHRDVKPSNVILQTDEAGQKIAKLLDFGIYKNTEPKEQSLTQTGQLLGTANYMSPEQCKREALDLRSDLYSLGCLMYETLYGSPPMQADSELAIMANQVHLEIEKLPAKPVVPRALQQVVLKLLRKKREDRYQQSDELISDLTEQSTKTLIGTGRKN